MDKYITYKFVEKVEIYSRPEEDFGFEYETHSKCEGLGDKVWNHTDSGLVKLDVLIQELLKLQDKGSNYVGCEWHCDHGEMELYGFHLNESTDDEVKLHLDNIKTKERKKKEEEIRLLEVRIENLKKSLES